MKYLKRTLLVGLLGTLLLVIFSCEDEVGQTTVTYGDLYGVVTDVNGDPVSGVIVTLSGINEDDLTTTSGSDGTYTFNDIPQKAHSVSFAKDGWLSIGLTIIPDSFNEQDEAEVNATLFNASAQIQGLVTDSGNGDLPLEGVKVSAGPSGTVVTDSDGSFTITNLIEDNYSLSFIKEGYVTVTRNISINDFKDGIVNVNVRLGGTELLPGLTADDLQNADKWYYNEYRGGRNADEYPHWDWSTNYMSTLDFKGTWQEQNEGTTLQIRNSGDDQNNPANSDLFDSFVYGSKLITEDNFILSLRLRTHSADDASPAHFGVQVIDLSEEQPQTVKIGGNRTYGSGDYTDFEFDLSDYIGKEVIIAIGIYRQETGDYWKQLVLRAIRFADRKVEGWGWLPGSEVVDGWKLTLETVRSTMPHIKKSFTGISPISGNRDNYVDAYRSWRGVDHIGAEWSLVPINKDPEVFPSEGYLIKTNNSPNVSTNLPEAYVYSKFSIAPGSNNFTLSTRNFGDNYTYFKLSAVENDGTVSHLSPVSNTAEESESADDGLWKFKHGSGGAGDPDSYAIFNYDLSQYNGSDVTLALGVYNVEPNTGENKLVIHNIELQ